MQPWGPPYQRVALSTLHLSGRNAVVLRTPRLTKEREDDATQAAAAWIGGPAAGAAFGSRPNALPRAPDQARHPVSAWWRERCHWPALGRQDEGAPRYHRDREYGRGRRHRGRPCSG